MVDVITQIEIALSRNKVADYLTNPDNVHECYVNIKPALTC